jgi:hypothetical protein
VTARLTQLTPYTASDKPGLVILKRRLDALALMDRISDTCDCDDLRHHEDGCDGETVTFRRVAGQPYALCRACSNGGHVLTAEGGKGY